MPLSSLLVLLVSLFYSGRNDLKLLEIGADCSCCGIQRFAKLGLILVGMVLELLKDEIGMSIEEQVCLRVIALGFIDLGLERVSMWLWNARARWRAYLFLHSARSPQPVGQWYLCIVRIVAGLRNQLCHVHGRVERGHGGSATLVRRGRQRRWARCVASRC